MAILVLRDKSFLVKLLKVFSAKRQITINMSESAIKIHSLSPPYIYASVPPELYELHLIGKSQPNPAAIEFTICTKDLLTSLLRIDTQVICLNGTHLILFKPNSDIYSEIEKLRESIAPLANEENKNTSIHTYSAEQSEAFRAFLCDNTDSYFIKIPLLTPIVSHYRYITDFSTKFLVTKNIIRDLLRGDVLYSNMPATQPVRGEGFTIDHSPEEVKELIGLTHVGVDYEERMNIEVESLREGYLDFYCNNSWVDELSVAEGLSSSILFGFSENVLIVKCTFEKYKKAYLELQISEKIR